jgi:hypothetical protein
MEHQRRAFFSEHEADDVTGFVIIEVNEDSEQYRVAEKWNRSEGDSVWLTYWISEQALADRMARDACSYKQQLSANQFEGILNLADVSHQYQKAVA